jgi:hypothetical protein
VKIQGAVVKEQGITFAIVIVKPPAMQTAQDSAKTRATFQGLFPGFQLVLGGVVTKYVKISFYINCGERE